MLECLDANNCLEYFSMKQSDSFLKLKISRFLQNNSYLKCLKLPGIFFFNQTSVALLCSYISNSVILEVLHISDTAIKFTEALSTSCSLKILKLKHVWGKSFNIGIDHSCELFNALSKTFIEELSMRVLLPMMRNKIFIS